MDFIKAINSDRIKNEIATIGLIFVCIVAAISTPLVHGDSHVFMSGGIHVPPLYRSFYAFSNVISSQYAINIMVILQSILLLISGVFFYKTLSKYFSIPGFAMFLASLPLYYYGYIWAHSILSEALVFPFFLLAMSFFISLIFSKNKNYLFGLALLIYLMIITRGQFVFSLTLLLVCSLFFFRKKCYSLFAISLILVPMIFAMSNFTQRMSTYITDGEFEAPSYGGIQLAAPAFYASSLTDMEALPSEYRDLGRRIILELEKNGLTHETYKNKGPYQPYPQNIAHQYRMLLDHICWAQIYEKIKTFSSSDGSQVEQMLKINAISKSMAIHLIMQSPKTFFTVVKDNLVFYSFGRTGTFLVFISIYLVIFILSITTGREYLFFLFGILTAYIMNVTIVSIFVFGYDRYLFYTDVVIAYVFVCFIFFLRDNMNKKTIES